MICDFILRAFVLKKIPIIPIFDSFIVKKTDLTFLKEEIGKLGF